MEEVIVTLAETPGAIATLVNDLSDEQLRRKGPGDQFSVVEQVCHLRDIEIDGYQARINRILEEDRPVLADINGAQLAVEREYNQQQLEPALQEFATARRMNLQIVKGLAEEALLREGDLDGVGSISLAQLLQMMREHDEGHLQELTALCK
jgi:hypothetical protein